MHLHLRRMALIDFKIDAKYRLFKKNQTVVDLVYLPRTAC